MTRTINLLSPEALERLQAGPEGTDAAADYDLPDTSWFFAPDPEPLPDVAGWEGAPVADCGCVYHAEEGIPCEHDLALSAGRAPAPLSATVDCGTCGYRVATGECCPRCDANCSLPASPANEEK